MRFQCTFCFTIIKTDDSRETKVVCPNCSKLVAVPKSSLETGCVVDDFVIQNIIGHGGMATVYLARQLSLDRPVALKVLADEYFQREKFRASFLKEAKAAARLNHPNIIQATRVGEESDKLFYAMEYIQGQTLANKIDVEKTMQLDPALNIIQQAAEALHAAWTQENLIHRDIKPDNIMLADDGYSKIMDLGIAITVDEAETAEVSGTPTYMAPEQFRRERLDCRTDIYSLGVTFYHALCGFPPFDGDSVKEIARKHVFNQLQFPSNDLIYLPQRIKRLISKMMAKEPADRYQDYDELLGDVVALRKRLAPDEDQIPNVHTISFSKYRLQEKVGANSPSEIYRRRSDQKKKVAIAKEQSEKVQKFATNKTPWYVVSVLIIVIFLLAGGIFFAMHGGYSKFYESAENYLNKKVEDEIQKNADLTEKDNECSLEISEIDNILARMPENPKSDDNKMKYDLLELKRRLTDIRMDIKFQMITLNQKAMAKEKGELIEEREKAGSSEQQLGRLKSDLSALRNELAAIRTQNLKKDTEINRLKAQLKQVEGSRKHTGNELVTLKKDAQRKLIRKTRLGLVAYCSDKKYSKAQKLIGTLVEENPGLKQWGGQSSADVANTKKIYAAVYNTDGRLKGVEIDAGKVLEIDRDNIRIMKVEDFIETPIEMKLSKLDVKDILKLAGQNWQGKQKGFEEAAVDYALYSGDFSLALKRVDGVPKKKVNVESFISDYLIEGMAEVQENWRLGNEAAAKVRLRDLREYRNLKSFDVIEEDFKTLSQKILRR